MRNHKSDGIFILLAGLAIILFAARTHASEDPDYGAPLPVKITQLSCTGLSDSLRDAVMETDFTGSSKSCRIMCQACGLCKCVTGVYKAADASLDYSLQSEYVSCEGDRFTLTAQGRTYDCQAPRMEYATIKAPNGLQYPGAAAIGYSYEIRNTFRERIYVLSTTDCFDDVIAHYEIVFGAPVAQVGNTGSFQRYLNGNSAYFQSVEVNKSSESEVNITIRILSPNPEDSD
jgi:hypothetical protein